MLGLSIKKLSSRWLSTLGKVVAIGLVFAILVTTFLISRSIESSFLKTNNKYDYIVGASSKNAKVSLDSVYFVNTPKSNISISYYEGIKDIKSLDLVVPLKQVDEYDGLQVVATTRDFFNNEVLVEGRFFSDKSDEIVIGSNIAKSKNLFVGSKIKLTHRTINNGGLVGDKVAGPNDGKPYVHNEKEYTVVGILDAKDSVYANLVYMDIEDSHNLHGDVFDDSKENSEELNTKNINALLIKSGGSEGLKELQQYLHNDNGVSLYKLEDSVSYVKEVRSGIEKLYPIVILTMFILLSLILSLMILGGIKILRKDIKAMIFARVPKSDIISYVILTNVIVVVLGLLISYPITRLVIGFINSILGVWSIVVSLSSLPIITLFIIPIVFVYMVIVSVLFINSVYEEV